MRAALSTKLDEAIADFDLQTAQQLLQTKQQLQQMKCLCAEIAQDEDEEVKMKEIVRKLKAKFDSSKCEYENEHARDAAIMAVLQV